MRLAICNKNSSQSFELGLNTRHWRFLLHIDISSWEVSLKPKISLWDLRHATKIHLQSPYLRTVHVTRWICSYLIFTQTFDACCCTTQISYWTHSPSLSQSKSYRYLRTRLSLNVYFPPELECHLPWNECICAHRVGTHREFINRAHVYFLEAGNFIAHCNGAGNVAASVFKMLGASLGEALFNGCGNPMGWQSNNHYGS